MKPSHAHPKQVPPCSCSEHNTSRYSRNKQAHTLLSVYGILRRLPIPHPGASASTELPCEPTFWCDDEACDGGRQGTGRSLIRRIGTPIPGPCGVGATTQRSTLGWPSGGGALSISARNHASAAPLHTMGCGRHLAGVRDRFLGRAGLPERKEAKRHCPWCFSCWSREEVTSQVA